MLKNNTNTDIIDKIESLELFVSTVNELRNCSYIKFVSQNKTSASFEVTVDEGVTITVNHPDLDAIKSLILTIRLFYQDNDRISLSNTCKNLAALSSNKDLIVKFETGRANLNEFLDSSVIIINNRALTYRKVIDVFFYGHFAHLDKRKNQIYKNWGKNDFLFSFLKTAFIGALNIIISFAFYFEDLIRCELEGISNKKGLNYITPKKIIT